MLPSVPAGWLEAYGAPPGRFAAQADELLGKLFWALASDLERFGLDSSHAVTTVEWLANAADDGEFVPPSLFTTPERARAFAKSVGATDPDTVIVGISLPAELRDELGSRDTPAGHLARLVAREESPYPGGIDLGFEVLGVDDDQLQSWLVGGLGRRAVDELHLALGELGLLKNLADASRVAALANDVAELSRPAHWAPWRLQRYA